MHGEPERPAHGTSPAPDLFGLPLACALFALDTTATATRLLGIPPGPEPAEPRRPRPRGKPRSTPATRTTRTARRDCARAATGAETTEV
ncbi:hypothetical protein KNE206_58740 [Kitasatospora sp. NE20-6]|uniref:hypothetical protein n=1 Tax=Kitasatospora sp. NE20-6 TaxID=2859066 RepID=UPI0034DC1511